MGKALSLLFLYGSLRYKPGFVGTSWINGEHIINLDNLMFTLSGYNWDGIVEMHFSGGVTRGKRPYA